jgi:hypothetical protein
MVLALPACSKYDATVDASDDASDDGSRGRGPEVGRDHWHAAYGVWWCDEFLEPLVDTRNDLMGIHTHQDGLIHIHPFEAEAAGDGAVLGVFADEVALGLEDDELRTPDGDRVVDGDDCGGAPGLVQVIEWLDVADAETWILHDVDLRSIALRDGQAITVAFRSPDTDPAGLLPPSASVQEEVGPVPTVPARQEAPQDTAPELRDLPPQLADCPPALRGGPIPVEGELRFRPVLAEFGSSMPSGSESVDADSSSAPRPRDCDDADELWFDGVSAWLELGEPLPTGMIESVEPWLDPLSAPDDGWALSLVLSVGSPGIDDFNELAAECSQLGPGCPAGRVAVVLGDKMLTAPVIMSSGFSRDGIQITGSFSQADAERIAAAHR